MTFPFTALVGHPDLVTALLVAAVDPGVGGVCVRGERGTAKSTAVRALTHVLPPVEVVQGCRFGCDPGEPEPGCPDGPHPPASPGHHRPARLVELPVGATEDRLLGALDLQRALTEGVRAFTPGLLAEAHRGVLYVDEVNLLPDHLVDALLDVAAQGMAHIERDGLSVHHQARFVLVGTMNPEEGELRPQLADRFGLTVDIAASTDPGQRAEVVRRRLAYDADPARFTAAHAAATADLARRIHRARTLLPQVVLGDPALVAIAAACAAVGAPGMRGDLVTARTARVLAAWDGRSDVTLADVRRAALLALGHRTRRSPFDPPGSDPADLREAVDRALGEPPPEDAGGDDPPPGAPPATPPRGEETGGDGADDHGGAAPGAAEAPASPTAAPQTPGRGGTGGAAQPAAQPGAPFAVARLALAGLGRGPTGRRSPAHADRGATVGSRSWPAGEAAPGGLHLPATLNAAAPHQVERGRRGPAVVLRPEDLRVARRVGREANLVLFALDASGSMAARSRMREVTAAAISLLLDAYQRRDTVGLITFRGQEATVVLPPTASVDVAARRLSGLPTGGRTPLAAGLDTAAGVLRSAARREPSRRALLVVVTDGRATFGGADPWAAARAAAIRLRVAGTESLVVDCETGPARLGLASRLAAELAGGYVPLAGLGGAGLAALLRTRRHPGRAA